MNKNFRQRALRCSINAGFTLVELMIALAVSTLVMVAVVTSFQSQHNVYLVQGRVVEMQENARVAMNMLEMDIRSAGYDPNDLPGIIGITAATADTLTFTRDDGTGVVETISYSLIDAFATEGRNDGVADDLGRSVGAGGLQPVAENIGQPGFGQLEFCYMDEDRNPLPLPLSALDRTRIRSIQVSILVLSAQRETTNVPGRDIHTTPYGVAWQAPVGFHNLYLTSMINCRNLGL